MPQEDSTKWFREAGFGIFCHILPGSKEELDKTIGRFDAAAFAEDCRAAGARYAMITLGQNSGFMNAPNAAYDRWAGPGFCAERDIVPELSEELARRGVSLMLYISGLAPKYPEKIWRGFGVTGQSDGTIFPTVDCIMNDAFVSRWSEVMGEYAGRYGALIRGWWVDGCYEWVNYTPDISEKYAKALKSANPGSILAFNPGAGKMLRNGASDYCAGEYDNIYEAKCGGPLADGAQWHEFSYLCETWGGGRIRCGAAELAAHINEVHKNGGVFTLDVPFGKSGGKTGVRDDAMEFLIEMRKRGFYK